MLTPGDRARYQRHLALAEIGEAGQEKLRAARVLIVGAGGLGSPAALYLAASGVGTLGLADGDTVELTNLQRQILFSTTDIGRGKTAAAAERLSALDPGLELRQHPVALTTTNVQEVIGAYDIVLDGTDRVSTRYLVNDACVLLGKPLVTAAIHTFEGQIMTYVPGEGTHRSPCYRCLFPEPSLDIPNCATAGVLGVLPGILGTLQATEAIKLILGIGESLAGRLLTYDALELRFHEFHFKRREDCAVCGIAPSITVPRDLPDAPAAETVRRLAPHELQAVLLAKTESILIVDVRDPAEFGTRHLPGAVNIPMHQLAVRLNEISPGQTLVFVCQSGKRSLAACVAAEQAGFTYPVQLEGGIEAWERELGDVT